jgi:hypothetical protein
MVLGDALAQLPRAYRRRILIRLDGAGASHGLIEHLLSLCTARRKVAFASGFTITRLEEVAIAKLPEHSWVNAVEQDGSIDPVAQVAELTGLWRRTGWPDGLRYIARRVKPTRRHAKKLTEFEKQTGWVLSAGRDKHQRPRTRRAWIPPRLIGSEGTGWIEAYRSSGAWMPV